MPKPPDIAIAPPGRVELAASGEQPLAPASDLGITALGLCEVVTPPEYAQLYLTAFGYSVQEAADLQQMDPSTVIRLRRSVRESLLASKGYDQTLTVANAVDTGFLVNPGWEKHRSKDKGVRYYPEIDDGYLKVLQLVCQGASNPQILEAVERPDIGWVNRAMIQLGQTLNARNRNHLVWRAYQSRVMTPTVPEMVLPEEYALELQTLEDLNHGRITSLPKDERRRGHEAHKRYEEFIITLLESPDFTIYHPKLATYCKEKYGYTQNDWRNLISKLGPKGYDIIDVKIHPDGGPVYGIELKVDSLLDQVKRPFITERVLETHRRAVEGSLEAPRLDTEHLNLALSEQTEDALLSPLRTAVGLSNPIMDNTFANEEQAHRTLRFLTGQPVELIEACLESLGKNGWINPDLENQIGKLNDKGNRLLLVGIEQTREKVEAA